MLRKNPYDDLVFLGPDGLADISGEELLQDFYQEWELAMMDFIDPLTGFTGRVTAKVLSTEDLERTVKAYEMFRKCCKYPEGYEKNLRAALTRGRNPEEYQVELELE
jgi:hypothetical protein